MEWREKRLFPCARSRGVITPLRGLIADFRELFLFLALVYVLFHNDSRGSTQVSFPPPSGAHAFQTFSSSRRFSDPIGTMFVAPRLTSWQAGLKKIPRPPLWIMQWGWNNYRYDVDIVLGLIVMQCHVGSLDGWIPREASWIGYRTPVLFKVFFLFCFRTRLPGLRVIFELIYVTYIGSFSLCL